MGWATSQGPRPELDTSGRKQRLPAESRPSAAVVLPMAWQISTGRLLVEECSARRKGLPMMTMWTTYSTTWHRREELIQSAELPSEVASSKTAALTLVRRVCGRLAAPISSHPATRAQGQSTVWISTTTWPVSVTKMMMTLLAVASISNSRLTRARAIRSQTTRSSRNEELYLEVEPAPNRRARPVVYRRLVGRGLLLSTVTLR